MDQTIKVDKIKKFLKDHNMTNKEFCERCGISNFVLKKILADETNFGVNVIFRVASFMNVKVSSLINYNFSK